MGLMKEQRSQESSVRFESFNDALIECVRACGGSKSVGVALWPAMGVEPAQRKLLACLNPERNEKLGPDEVIHVMRLAREKGCHSAIEHLCDDLGYTRPEPIDARDELADLIRQYLARNDENKVKDARLERLLSEVLKPRVA